MKVKTWHQIHKYLAIFAGLFLLAWTVSGIVMMLPMAWFEPTPIPTPERIDYSGAMISPAVAVERLEDKLGTPVEVITLELKTIQGRPVYDIIAANVGSKLIDAMTGAPYQVTQKVAEQIARGAVASQAEIQSTVGIKEHNISYPFGPLPVFRIVFADRPGVYYYVTTQDGVISQSNWLTRVRSAVVNLHTFEPLMLLTDKTGVRQGLLVVTAAAGVLVALTGYYIAILPALRRRQRKMNGSKVINIEGEETT
jgi:hypothetical protein